MAKGRIQLWLEPELVAWLTEHDLCGKGADGRHDQECGFIQFRARTALHKSGIDAT